MYVSTVGSYATAAILLTECLSMLMWWLCCVWMAVTTAFIETPPQHRTKRLNRVMLSGNAPVFHMLYGGPRSLQRDRKCVS